MSRSSIKKLFPRVIASVFLAATLAVAFGSGGAARADDAEDKPLPKPVCIGTCKAECSSDSEESVPGTSCEDSGKTCCMEVLMPCFNCTAPSECDVELPGKFKCSAGTVCCDKRKPKSEDSN